MIATASSVPVSTSRITFCAINRSVLTTNKEGAGGERAAAPGTHPGSSNRRPLVLHARPTVIEEPESGGASGPPLPFGRARVSSTVLHRGSTMIGIGIGSVTEYADPRSAPAHRPHPPDPRC